MAAVMKIVVIGDSIVYRSIWKQYLLERMSSGPITYTPPLSEWESTFPESRADYYLESPSVRIYDSGIGGNKATQVLARFGTDVVANAPDFCLIYVGINDMFAGVTPAACASTIEDIAEACIVHGIVPILSKIVPIGHGTTTDSRYDEIQSKILTLNSLVGEVATGLGIEFIDFHTPMSADPGYIVYDGVHLSASGQVAMGSSIPLSVFGIPTYDFDVLLIADQDEPDPEFDFDFDVVLLADPVELPEYDFDVVLTLDRIGSPRRRLAVIDPFTPTRL